jgi:hypothetical protein
VFHALANVVFLGGVEQIGNTAFSQCTSLRQIVLPLELEVVDTCAFTYCSALVGAHITWICAFAFEYCTSIQHMNLSRGRLVSAASRSSEGNEYAIAALMRLAFCDYAWSSL